MSLTGFGLKVTPISTATACGKSNGNKVINEIFMNKYIEYKKQYEKGQQTIKLFDKLYRKSLEGNVIEKNEYESSCIIFSNSSKESKNESLL